MDFPTKLIPIIFDKVLIFVKDPIKDATILDTEEQWQRCGIKEVMWERAEEPSPNKQGGSPTRSLTCFRNHILCIHCNIRFENIPKYVDTVTLFSKT